MEPRKLKRLAILIIVILIVILTITHCEIKDESKPVEYGETSSEVTTDVPFDISSVEDDRFIRDFTNPTAEEENAAYERYGKNGCYFSGDGLHITRSMYTEPVLMTNLILEDNEIVKMIEMPDKEKIDYLEYGDGTLKIYLRNVTEKETKEYVKDIKDVFKYEKSTQNIYSGTSEGGHSVLVTYDKINSKALFSYKLYKEPVE